MTRDHYRSIHRPAQPLSAVPAICRQGPARALSAYRSIATMDKKAPLPKIAAQTPTWHKAAALARKWQLNQLAGRLEEMGRQ